MTGRTRLCCAAVALLGLAWPPAPTEAGMWLPGDHAAISQGCDSKAAARFLADAWETDAIAVGIAHRMLTRSGDCPRLGGKVIVKLIEPVYSFVDYRGESGTVWHTDARGTDVFVLIRDDSGPHEAV